MKFLVSAMSGKCLNIMNVFVKGASPKYFSFLSCWRGLEDFNFEQVLSGRNSFPAKNQYFLSFAKMASSNIDTQFRRRVELGNTAN